MDEKLQILLKQIALERSLYSYFEGGMLKRIVGNNEKTKYRFELTLKKTLPYSVYQTLKNALNTQFSMFDDVLLLIDVEAVNYQELKDYYSHFLDQKVEQAPILAMYYDITYEINNHQIVLTFYGKEETKKYDEIKEELLEQLTMVGLPGVEIKYNTRKREVEQEDELVELARKLSTQVEQKKVVVEEPMKPKFKRGPLIKEKDNPTVVIGRTIDTAPTIISNVLEPNNSVTIEGTIYGNETIETKTGLKIVSLKITDDTDSIYGKLFIHDDEEYKAIMKGLKSSKWFLIRGAVKDDAYSKELVLNIHDMNVLEKQEAEIMDTAPTKRIELHAHTHMSQMDGVVAADTLLKQAHKWGHKAIAITDHNGVQSFPIVYKTVKGFNKGKEKDDRFKAIYGVELVMIDDEVNIVNRPNSGVLLDQTYVVFDFETTGFNAGGGDSIIEIGAVKICNGEIIDRFDELINPGRTLPKKIVEITQITDEMLKDKDNEESAIKRFIEWYEDLPMVAHNAKFDISFLEMCYQKYRLGTFTNTVIDTLELSRTLDHNYARHGLSALVKRYDVPWDETAHHRADYDAEGTALVFHKMLKKLNDTNIEKMTDLDKLVSKEEIHKFGRACHINLLAKDKVGLKNLFQIMSLASTKYLYKTPRILRSEIQRLREGLLIGSGCYEGEVFKEARSKSDEELTNIIQFYDYVEVQPIDCYDHLLQMQDLGSQEELIGNIKKVVRVSTEAGKIVVATGDVHHLTKDDKIYREIIVNQKVPGGGRHPLARNNISSIPSNHFRTTNEMLSDFAFLGEAKAKEIVIENPNLIAKQIEELEVIIETGGVPFSPKIENSVEIVKDLVYTKAHDLYGDLLPELISERIEQELTGIINGGYDVIYLICQKLVKKSNDEGYLVGSRGSVGSSFIATLMGITEVNPLPAHYVCGKCKHTIFNNENGEAYGKTYSSGYDLPDRDCPNCQVKMNKEGQDIPFATFLGFNADKVPDIDLNFSGEYQWQAHEYTKELFGVDNVYRAGTVGTVASKTAFGFVKGYCEDKGIQMRTAEIERLSLGCTGVKRTTGQHPGGIVVIPDYMDVFDFTPFQYPADDVNSAWRTTHFDYHAIEEDVLKLDILGHDDPTQLRMLQDLSGIDVTTLPFDDEKVLSLLSSTKALGVDSSDILCDTGTLGLPELGTRFVIGMLMETKPQTFSELIKISGLSHGTDVWSGNASELIKNNIVPFKEVIGCRDDIMLYLMNQGMKPIDAFKIMEFVRKGRPSKEPDTWKEYEQKMQETGIPKWYIDSCYKIKYMFPKAHAVAYVMSALRIAWFKVYHPIWYYASYFSVRCSDFDIDAMIAGYQSIKNKMMEITNKGREASNKELEINEVLKIALEANARGIVFKPLDLLKSDAVKFVIDEDNTSLIPPFRAIDGLGDTVAKNIVEEREKGPFLSIEDLQKRAKISATLIDKMRIMGILDGMDESSQLSLF